MVPVAEEVVDDLARMPPWDEIWISRSLDRLQEDLTRQPFMDRAWQLSGENLKALTVYLADNMEPFDKEPYLPVMHAATLLMLLRLVDRSRGASTKGASTSTTSSKDGAKRKEGKGGVSGAPKDMYSCLKYCMKKSGLSREAAYVSEFDLVR